MLLRPCAMWDELRVILLSAHHVCIRVLYPPEPTACSFEAAAEIGGRVALVCSCAHASNMRFV